MAAGPLLRRLSGDEGTMRETDFLVAYDGVDWCVLEAHTIHGWYPTKEEAVRCAAAAARRTRAHGVYARVVVKLQQVA